MASVRAVLFDLGDTLLDSRPMEEALRAAYDQIRARIEAVAYMEVPELLDLVERVARGVDQLVAGSYEERRMEELDVSQAFGQALSRVGFDLPDDVIAHIVALDHSAYARSLSVDPRVVEVLGALRMRGYRMALVSNLALRSDLMRGEMERLGIAPCLQAMVFSSDVGCRKPDRRIFAEALRRLGGDSRESVFVGDRLVDDIAGARSMGLRTVLTKQFRQEEEHDDGPDAIIGDLSELPAVLERWGG